MKNTFLLLLFCLCTTFSFGQNVERIEPANWWVGMKHNKIQLLIHGEKIADLKPMINYPDVSLRQIIQVENPNYLFLNITIGENAKAGEIAIDFYKNDKKVTTKPFSLLEREKGEIDGFDASDAIYLITPDRFVNGEKENDSIDGLKEKVNRSNKGGRHGGDIAGIRQSLDYIKGLGFTAVWLNPLLENDMEEYSYHGYSTTDFYKVDERFGSNEEYQTLAREGRAKGLKLIMDMIVNHCGSNHWWMNDLPSSDWINQWEEYTETNHRKAITQDPYASESDTKVFTDGWFVRTMPDLNQRNEFMATYLIQNSIWWVEYLKLSGIRMDTYPYPDQEFMSDWTMAMMYEYPTLNIVGEEWSDNPAIVSYWQKGKVNSNGYTSELKSLMDFPVQVAMVKALTVEENWSGGLMDLYKIIAQDFLYADPMNLVTFPDNHDMTRFYKQVNEDFDIWKQGIAIVTTMRGIPQMYYGTEILMTSPKDRDDGIIRSDFPGGWEGDEVDVFAGKGLTAQQKEATAYIKKLLTWRKTATALHTGKLKHFVPKDGVYVYFRYDDNQKVMVILNKNETASQLDLSRFSEMFEGERKGRNALSEQEFLLTGELEVEGKSATILELKK
ncbi:MAG: glycosidase [Saprospiraceae bacterium]|jgi:glycosidase